MSTEYAGSLFDTEHDAQIACVHDWITAHGSTPTVQALKSYWTDPGQLAHELRDDIDKGRWSIPGEVDPDGGIEDLLEAWEEEARRKRLREIRVDILDMSQGDFARMLSIAGGQQAISKYERGIIAPSRQTVMLASMMSDNPELWDGRGPGAPPTSAEAKRLWAAGNNDGEGYAVGDEDDGVNELADELGELVRPAGTDDDVAVYRTASDRFVGVADANGPWAVDLS